MKKLKWKDCRIIPPKNPKGLWSVSKTLLFKHKNGRISIGCATLKTGGQISKWYPRDILGNDSENHSQQDGCRNPIVKWVKCPSISVIGKELEKAGLL